MKDVPFYANTPDDMRCVQACYRMVLKHFLPEKEFSWEEIGKVAHAELGKGTWWHPGLLEMQKLGLEVSLIEPFDYQQFYENGLDYLYKIYPKPLADWHKEKSNLFTVKHLIPEFLEKCHFENRPATFDDLDTYLAQDWLVGTEVNARTLNGKEGLSPHMILIFAKENNEYHFHDPGLPPLPNRKATQMKLLEARQYAGKNSLSLVAFRYPNTPAG